MELIKQYWISYWESISHFGFHHLKREPDRRRQEFLNRLLLLATITSTLYLFIELFLGMDRLVLVPFTSLISCLVMIIMIYLGYVETSKYIFLVTCIFLITGHSIATSGTLMVEVLLLPLSAVPAIIFKKRFASQISVFMILLCLIGILEYNNYSGTSYYHKNGEILKRINLIASAYFVYVIVNYFRKSNAIFLKRLEHKNTLIEESKREILNSINYASGLQEAVLPNDHYIKEYFPESFIFYRPKDIVSGDFYWFSILHDKVYFSVADCTGHGVPGALVSVVGHSGLYRCVKEFKIEDPGKVLDSLCSIVSDYFNRNAKNVKDGMDIALCSYSEKTKILEYAGAYNSLWVIRGKELTEYKANRQPVGKYEGIEPFVTHRHHVEKGDIAVMYTDGYADQFGGPNLKKLKAKNFKKVLIENAHRSMDEIYEALKNTYDDWKGDEEQVDDVCVMVVRF